MCLFCYSVTVLDIANRQLLAGERVAFRVKMHTRQNTLFPHKYLYAVLCVSMYNEYYSLCGFSCFSFQSYATVNYTDE